MGNLKQNIDPRGLYRTIVRSALDSERAWMLVELDCGHTERNAAHFTYTPGERIHCFTCGELARKGA